MANPLIVTSQNIEGCEISNTLVKIQESIQKGNKNDQHIYGSKLLWEKFNYQNRGGS